MLENTEGAIKNRQSRETVNKRQRIPKVQSKKGQSRETVNKRQRIPKVQSKKDNPEKL